MNARFVWQTWWRSVDGKVTHDKGFALRSNPDCFFFGIDPESDGDPVNEDDEEHYQHVDDLFENEADARAHAIAFLREKIDVYQKRLTALVEGAS
jgi:hypothetical protein